MSESEIAEDDHSDNSSKENSSSVITAIRRAIKEFWNLSLIGDARDDLSKTAWFTASVRVYQIGIVILVMWSAYIVFITAFAYLISSQGIISIASRIGTVGPLVPIGIYLFARFSRRVLSQLTYDPTEDDIRREDLIMLFALCLVSFLLAWVVRMGLFSLYVDAYGTDPTWLNILSMMFTDGLYVGLLLMGLGSAAMLVFAPQDDG